MTKQNQTNRIVSQIPKVQGLRLKAWLLRFVFTIAASVACVSIATAQGWPGRVTENSQSSVTPTAQASATVLHFDELPFQPVRGLTFAGVTFNFTINGSPSNDANYHAQGPGQITFVQDPSLEGSSAGVLTLDFATPTGVLQFGLALNTFDRIRPGATVQLFDSSFTEIRTFRINTSPLVSFSEAQFNYFGPPDVKRAVISFSNSASRFALDNLGFSPPSASLPSVITVDGTHIISVLNPSYPPDPTHYLYDAIDPYWTSQIESRVGTIAHFDWSRNIYDTDDYVLMLSAVLEGLTKSSKKNHSPLVVVSHSWGTVLAYIAISRNRNIVVDKFITLGSPLNAQNATVNAFTKETLARWNINQVGSLHNVRTWSNYWAQCDPISGSIPATRGNILITTDYIDNEFLTCHGAFFADYAVWQQVLFNVSLTK